MSLPTDWSIEPGRGRAGKWRLTSASLALVLWALPALAAPPCTASDNPCDPDKLCTFKASLAEKVFLYQAYLRNSQKAKASGSRDGVSYTGTQYNAAIAQAKAKYPDATRAEQMVQAGVIFQDNLRAETNDKFKPPECKEGQINGKWLPKGGDGRYQGMTTNAKCQTFVNFCPSSEPCSAEAAGNISAEGFGDSDATSCPEFYDRDRAHEKIHQLRCKAGAGGDIGAVIEDEVVAYEHSVRLTQAYLRLLSLQCSAMPTPGELRARAAAVQNLLAPYLAK
jgi:hypothetical protein